ncbi:MAG: AtpZ/AtpI family protein [Candidatus Magasanikbacteria bacterium]
MSLLPTDPKDRKYMLMGLRIAGDFGASIAVPVILFVLIGQWLDGKYEKTPLFTVIAFILAALVSGKMLYKKAKKYGKEYNDLDN